jgi:hypothetical protein
MDKMMTWLRDSEFRQTMAWCVFLNVWIIVSAIPSFLSH